MSTLRTLHTLIDDEQRNCEYLAQLKLACPDDPSEGIDEDLPLLVDVRVLETRELDEQGNVVRETIDPGSITRVAELLEDVTHLRAALDGEVCPSVSCELPHSRGTMRRVVERQRAANRQRLQESAEREVG